MRHRITLVLSGWPLAVAVTAGTFLLSRTVLAVGTLVCTVATGCGSGIVVLRLSGLANAHAELPGQSNYAQLVCCSGVPGLSNTCSGGAHAVALKLSGTTNAHVEQGTQSNYAQQACLSVPSGGAVAIGYQSGNCDGYDTTLASISAVTNAHVGSPTAYPIKVCGHGLNGSLSADIVDAGGTSVPSPTVTMSSTATGFACGGSTGTFGIASQKIRIGNWTPAPQWTLAVAATSGPTAMWSSAGQNYDFNDPSNCADGGDADAYAGRMTVDPSAVSIAASTGCGNTGLSIGPSASFSEGVTDSVTLMSAGASADNGCNWDLTGVSVGQTIPAEQPVGSYSLNLTVTVTAS